MGMIQASEPPLSIMSCTLSSNVRNEQYHCKVIEHDIEKIPHFYCTTERTQDAYSFASDDMVCGT